jgi:hypothetical protein
MIISQEIDFIKAESEFASLRERMDKMCRHGVNLAKVESALWEKLRPIGLALMEGYVCARGQGDVGEELEVEGETLRRLPELHPRRVVTVFGELMIDRYVYGTRETQKHEVIPLDAALGLPEHEHTDLLQDWSQALCVEQSFGNTKTTLQRILGFDPSVHTLERMNRSMATAVPSVQADKPAPAAREEGPLVVITADCKGIPMRRGDGDPPAASGRRTKGQKANKKRMACVGAVYTIKPFIRESQDVVDELQRAECRQVRPKPQNKHVRAALTQEIDGKEFNGKDVIFEWVKGQVAQRNPQRKKPVVCVMDGERGLWARLKQLIPACICILDLFHVLERLWGVAHCFHPEGSAEAKAFVEDRLTRILEGNVGRVIGGIRQMATKRRLSPSRRKILNEAIGYLHNNRDYMHYDEYLARGYPIGSGVAEGACRHLVKDRMERTGMRWRVEGAQAMIDLRAVYVNDDWDAFQAYRSEREQRRLYPYKDFLKRMLPKAA